MEFVQIYYYFGAEIALKAAEMGNSGRTMVLRVLYIMHKNRRIKQCYE